MDNPELHPDRMNVDNQSEDYHSPPPCGIVSRRVFHSPVVKWVFPARIRDEQKNDVIFIGQNLIELKEWDAEKGALRDIANKADFGSSIRCGAVIGDKTASSEHVQSVGGNEFFQNLQKPLPPQILVLSLASFELAFLIAATDDTGFVSFQTHFQKLPANKPLEQAGKFIATDSKSRAMATSAAERTLILYGIVSPIQRATSSLSEIIRDELILTVDMAILKMDFLYPPTEDEDRVTLAVIGVKKAKTFAYIFSWDSEAPLRPSNIQINKQALGKELGILISLIPLKTAGYFMLIDEQMRFLYHVSTDGLVEQTDSEILKDTDPPKPSISSLCGTSCRKPLWINWARPMRNSDWPREAVYLGREDGAIQYVELFFKSWSNRLGFNISGHAGNVDGAIDTAFAILDMHHARNDSKNMPQDDNDALEHRKYRLGYPDALVVPGNFGDGGLYEVGFALADGYSTSRSRAEIHTPRMRVPFRNWAPFSDICVIDTRAGQKKDSRKLFSNLDAFTARVTGAYPAGAHERLLVACGKEPYGAIGEVRLGFEVQCKIPRKLPHRVADQEPSLDLNHCTGIWPIELSSTDLLILFSFPWRTVFATIGAETGHLALVESGPGRLLIFDESTLTASKITVKNLDVVMEELDSEPVLENIIIHVSSTQIQVLKLTETWVKSSNSISASLVKSWPLENVFGAASQRSGPWLLIATQASQADSVSRISLKRIISENLEYDIASVGPTIDFDEDISCVTFLELYPRAEHSGAAATFDEPASNRHHAAVGTTSGNVHLFAIDSSSGLHRLIEHNTCGDASHLAGLSAIESIGAIQRPDLLDDSFLILCGSRQGMLIALNVELGDITQISGSQALEFGHGSLTVISDPSRIGNAFVCCGPDLCVVDFTRDNLEEVRTTSLFYTDALDRSYSHGILNALCHLPSTHFTGALSGCLMGLSDSEIVLGSVQYREKHLPIRRRIPGTPKRLLYSDHLKSLIIACTVTQIYQGRRYAIPTIALLDPNLSRVENVSQEEIDDYDFKFSSFRFDPGERLCDMIEWFISKDEQHYHFLVATTLARRRDGIQVGRIVFVRPTRLDNGKMTIKFMFDKHEVDPIFAISQTEDGSLIYCCGNSVMMRTYDPDTNRFNKRILKSQMPSPGIQISVFKSTVVVTTQLHSTLVFHFDEFGQFTGCGSDSQPRAGISHLTSFSDPFTFIYMASISQGMPSVRAWQGARLGEAVEAILPSQVTAVEKLQARPKWKGSNSRSFTIMDRDVVGIATDGSLYTFTIVNEAGWLLLYFLETLCLRDHRICRVNSEEKLAVRPLHVQASDGAHSHINGDILCRLLDMTDPRSVLMDMMQEEPIKNGIDPETGIVVDCQSIDERYVMLAMLVFAATDNDKGGFESGEEEEEEAWRRRRSARLAEEGDLTTRTLRSLRNMLELPF